MAKQSTVCDRCDGKFDGTPSGWLKHQRTVKHNSAKPMVGDGVPEGFPDAFAGGGPVAVADDEGRVGKAQKAALADDYSDDQEFTVAKEEVIAATEEAIEAKVAERQPEPQAEPEDASPLAEAPEAPEDAAIADAAIELSDKAAAKVKAEPVYMVTEYAPVVLPDFDPADLPELPDTLSFTEFAPYTFPHRTEAVQGFAEDNAEELAEAELEVAKGKRYVRHGKLHSLKLLPKYEAQLASALNRLEAAQITKAGIEAYDDQLSAAWYDVARAYWERVHAAITEASGDDQGKLELQGSVPSICFRSAVVNGPRLVYEGSERIVVPATVTLGIPVASIEPEMAESIGRDLAAAGRYALAFNRVIGL